MTETIKKEDHARENAKAWVENMAEMVAKLTREGAAGVFAEALDEDQCHELLSSAEKEYPDSASLKELRELASLEELRELVADAIREKRIEPDGFEFDDEQAREEIQNSPLSVQVRSGWITPGEEMEAEEFEILLSTGGPALRIRGELNQYREPDRAWLEYQDWGTPWTQYFEVEQQTLLTFAQCFYFGE